jgi:hypothetical protein
VAKEERLGAKLVARLLATFAKEWPTKNYPSCDTIPLKDSPLNTPPPPGVGLHGSRTSRHRSGE